jgi:fructosamine-3-kinase
VDSHLSDAAIGAWLTDRTGRRCAARPTQPVHGGSISRCVRWAAAGGDVFVKLAPAGALAAFEAEAEGLQDLRASGAVRVPAVQAVGLAGGHAILALEWLELSPTLKEQPGVQALLGRKLATLHRVTATAFGWRRDNTIGATPQPNAWDVDWVRFFRERRLGHQLTLAAAKGLPARVQERGRLLEERCPAFFRGHRPEPSLLHGDLWSGNWGVDAATREPVLFDPAVYFGDREADIAFTHCFGGFSDAFHAAYAAEWTPDPGADARRPLYNLYHVLNHYVLFGGGYARQAASMIDSLLAQLG